jgi:SAM-dependent methyltransferase
MRTDSFQSSTLRKIMRTNDHDSIRQQVRTAYAAVANTGSSCCATAPAPAAGGCCAPSDQSVAELLSRGIGYSAEETAAVPDGANLGLGCGNPQAIAALQPGEVVLDLGSGAGFDCFLAARAVGETGRVIGVDMTPDMISKARGNATKYTNAGGYANVEFRLGEIEHLPVADASIDVIISNCVINLSPDKAQVWREIARVLKPGGRVAVSDMVLLKPLPPKLAAAINAYVGCIAGASLLDDLRTMMRDAGLVKIELMPKPAYVETLSAGDDPLYRQVRAALPDGGEPGDYVSSMDIAAKRPGPCCAPGCC